MSKTVELLDFCLPDYFSGYPKPVIAIPVYEAMTKNEVGKAIQDEINAIYEYLEHRYSEEEIKLLEDYANSLKGDNEEFINPKYDVNIEDDFFEPAYLYFAVCEITYSNGMRFLNP